MTTCSNDSSLPAEIFYLDGTLIDSTTGVREGLAAEAGLAFMGVAWGYGRLAATSDTVVCGNLAELRRQLPGFGLRRRPSFHEH